MTGVIYVAIIAVWAVVLVPAWLRRHDHLDPERSVDRFTRSMQTLAKRPTVLGIPMPVHEQPPVSEEPAEVLRPSRAARLRVGVRAARPSPTRKAATPAQVSSKVSGPTAPSKAPARRPTAARRRRIVLAVLLAALAAVGGLVAAGVLLPVALAAPGALIVCFLALARHQVRAARRARSRRLPTKPARVQPTAPTSSRTESPAPGALGATWEPLATPLPSYVTAPPAAGFPRMIDTQTPGAWTAAAMLERAQKEKLRIDRMAAAKAEAIARARAEQQASEQVTRDERYLTSQAARPVDQHDTIPLRRIRAVNE